MDALDNDRVFIVCQPIVNAITGVSELHEVLCRLRDKDGNVIGPGEFIERAETMDLIQPIDRRGQRQRMKSSNPSKKSSLSHSLTIHVPGACGTLYVDHGSAFRPDTGKGRSICVGSCE